MRECHRECSEMLKTRTINKRGTPLLDRTRLQWKEKKQFYKNMHGKRNTSSSDFKRIHRPSLICQRLTIAASYQSCNFGLYVAEVSRSKKPQTSHHLKAVWSTSLSVSRLCVERSLPRAQAELWEGAIRCHLMVSWKKRKTRLRSSPSKVVVGFCST